MRREKIFGIHAVKSILANHPGSVLGLYVISGSSNNRIKEIIELALSNNVTVSYLGREELDKMAEGRHQGVVIECGEIKQEYQHDLFGLLEGLDHAPFLLILDGVQDPHNLGACLRSANAAGVDAVIAPKDNAVGITAAVRKVASGAAEVTPFYQVTNLSRTIDQLKSMGIWVYGFSDQGKSSLFGTDLSGPVALVMGAEEKGMRRLTVEKCDAVLCIPMRGTVSSMNVSVATGVALFEAVRQRN